MDDEEERDQAEGAPGVRHDMRTHGIHIPGADQNDQDDAEDACGVSRAAGHRNDSQKVVQVELGVYRINRVRKALDISQNSLLVWISSRNGTKGGIGQIISGIVTNIACNSLRICWQFVAYRCGRGYFLCANSDRHGCVSFLASVPTGLPAMATAALKGY